ncbi:hypothetical protein F4553_004481 [Allocatelliglobosispora scoriae]|uniref:Uncharacterized protein n=1 Tax=Allocatelliglobosispora scoriae TaxID=643052 RepID=A0A841BWF8_9ACTN|nr:hypothetical protein [Allocatelliglobosispora scoriae]MBB5871102.1 hypothetical protein [Allocatelliglobosispora scoriae]
MSDQDRLRAPFDDFRDRCLAETVPPGVDALRRTVRRRRTTRAMVAAGVAALVTIAAIALPGLRATPTPTEPTPSPTVSESVPPSPTPTPTMSPSASPSHSTAPGSPRAGSGSGKQSGSGADPCYVRTLYWDIGPEHYYLPPGTAQKCPSIKIKLVWAKYGWSPADQKIVRLSSSSTYLTAARPSFNTPDLSSPDNRCNTLTVLMRGNVSLPASIPNYFVDTSRVWTRFNAFFKARGAVEMLGGFAIGSATDAQLIEACVNATG